MKKFWTFLVVACLAGAAGYVYRAQVLAYIPPEIQTALHLAPPQAAADAKAGDDKSAGAGKGGTQGASQGDAGKSGKGGGKGGKGGVSTVRITEAKTGTLPLLRRSSGFVQARAATQLTAPIAGTVASIAVADGAEVKKGDVIVDYDSRALNATLEKDKATLAKDQVIFDSASVTLERSRNLGQAGAFSQQSVDNAQSAVNQAAAAMTVDRAQIEADKVSISYLTIRAPYDGKIGAVLVSPGAFVPAGTPVATVVNMRQIYAQFTLPEADLRAVREALDKGSLTAKIRPTSVTDGTVELSGQISFIDNTIDQASGTFRLWASLDNNALAFWPGESVAVTVTAGQSAEMVLVPSVAVQPQQDGSVAYVAKEDGTAEARKVTIGLRQDDMTGITDGLSAGDKVIVEGQGGLTNGAKIQIDDGTAKPGKKDGKKGEKKNAEAKDGAAQSDADKQKASGQ